MAKQRAFSLRQSYVGSIIERIRQRRYEDLPKMSENLVSHVRPHGRNDQDKIMAPDGSMVKKQCFWLNAKYVAEQVGAEPWSVHMQSKPPLTNKGSLIAK